MTSTYSPALLLELMATGDQSGTWGTTTNGNLGTLLEQAITGVLSVAQGDATLTLTSVNGASDQARNAVVNLTGAMTAQRNVVVPTSNKVYLIKNSTTGGFGVNVTTVGGTGVVVAPGTSQWLYCDGTNVVQGLTGGFAPDANNNVSVNNAIQGFTTTATAAGTTTLTIASTALQVFTGSTTQTVKLPTTSVVAGTQYQVNNLSSGAVTVQSSGANTIVVLAAGTSAVFTAQVATPTAAANWSAQYLGDIVASGKSLTVSNSLTLTGTDATTMTFPSTSATIARTDAANTFTGTQTFSGVVTVNGTGTSTITGPLSIATATGGQIAFPATQNPSANPNTLDDYEEGTWTPGVTFGGSATGITYSAQIGYYVKIGRLLYASFSIVLSSKGAQTGGADITGMPFTIGDGSNTGGGAFSDWASMASIVGNVMTQALSGTTTALLLMSGATNAAQLTNSNFTNTSNLAGIIMCTTSA